MLFRNLKIVSSMLDLISLYTIGLTLFDIVVESARNNLIQKHHVEYKL